ncbi:uncharacterized protein beat-IV [Calliphora vicina]|uniref:uncharacterized protein beat-IV n=1 Tax=Calliphora vicina TaxID=7373 RepID=UPI00325C0081
MNLAFDTRIFILICCLLQGLAGLRLIKVSIPAYKLRGESAFLECQYELNKSRGTIGGTQTRSRHNYNHHHYQRGSGATNMNYVDNNESQEELSAYRRMRTQEQQQQQMQQQPYRRQPYFQPLVQAYQAQWQGGSGSSSSSSSSSSIGSASGSITTHTGTYYQQQYPYQAQQQQQQSYYTQQYEQPEYQQHTPPPSPYGHSIYRGRTQTSSSSSSSSLPSSSIYNSKYGVGGGGGAQVGASTHTGKTYISSSGIIGGSSSFAHHPARGDDSNTDSNERDHTDDADENTNEDDDDDEVENEGGALDRDHDEDEGEDLYAIKWYKDNEEFYRYVPKANPPKTSYRVDGVRVIEEHSDSTRVLLRGLTINSTGLYRCEVSAEAPNFSSVQGEGRMDIVYLPRDGPHIKGQQFQYQIGETLNLNCTSGKSHPASHLQWFINDQAVVDGHYLVRYNDTVHRHGLITSTLGLEMTVDGRHFNNGAMRVKCLASISPVLWKGGKESVLQRRPGIIDNREAMLLVRSSSTSLHHRYHHYNNIFNTLAQLRVLAITTILMKLCQLLLLHTEYT